MLVELRSTKLHALELYSFISVDFLRADSNYYFIAFSLSNNFKC